MRNVVLFGDPLLAMARSQLEPFLRAVQEHQAFRVAAVVNTSMRPPAGWAESMGQPAKRRLMRAFNPDLAALLRPYPSMEATAAQYGLKVTRPPGLNINALEFRTWASAIEEPRVAISLGCLQIFKQDLLDCFEQIINFHNGLLPDYRGLGATAWSLYNGEKRSGFSFHRMTAGLDDGPVLLDGSIDVADTTCPGALEAQKLEAAAKLAPSVLDAVHRNEPGRTQPGGEGRVYTARDRRSIQRIEDPASLTAAEIRRRSRCFTELEICLGDGWWPVTAVSAGGRPAIPNRDGEPLGVERARFVPSWIYRAARAAGFA